MQGNVQPHFIGVFYTVTSLRTAVIRSLVWGVTDAVATAFGLGPVLEWRWFPMLPLGALLAALVWQLGHLRVDIFKFYSDVPKQRLRLWRPSDWPQNLKTGHFASWNKRNFDMWLDPDVQHARHAMTIDEDRADLLRAGRASMEKRDRHPEWLKQVWFPGFHSDFGGSYPEAESRLSDIALDWMVEELRECVPSITITEHLHNRTPDPLGLQHREDTMVDFGPLRRLSCARIDRPASLACSGTVVPTLTL